jgi:hypothetical protein
MTTQQLVPKEVSRRKFQRELENWKQNEAIYRQRGWLLVRQQDLTVDIAFASVVRTSSSPSPLPVISVCIRLDFSNYDLWPPSVVFIDLFSGQPCLPHVRALITTPDGPRDLLVNGHPETRLPFLCVPGTREYHAHPQHTGDHWLLHRRMGAGALATISDRIWRSMARNVLGIRVTTQTFPAPINPGVDLRLVQGDVDALVAQVTSMQSVMVGSSPQTSDPGVVP